MAHPTYYGSGTTARRTDTRLMRWTKWLGMYQNLPGADPRYDPRRTDTLRIIKWKLLRAMAVMPQTAHDPVGIIGEGAGEGITGEGGETLLGE
jgi:hypothetical protein